MKIGEYARTKDGYISKITDNFCTLMKIATNKGKHIYDYIDIRKSSPNIIDLIEVGDYVNGSKVIKTNCKLEYIDDDSDTGVNEIYDGLETEKNFIYFEYEIETIVTKEQFKGVEYRMGDNK